jgi:hypothetical protein
VVFDNVDDPPALLDPAHAVVPAALSCRLLFTTRRRGREFVTVSVDALPEGTALVLLASRAGRVRREARPWPYGKCARRAPDVHHEGVHAEVACRFESGRLRANHGP